MKAHLGVFIAESPAPLPFPLSENQWTPLGHQRETMDQVNDERALLGLVTPRDYYITSLKRVAATQPSDLSFAWNASTSSTHLHMSFDSWAWNEMHDRNQTLWLCAQLIAKNSLDIQDNPLERRKERGMSEERFAARSKIVATRAQLWEVLDPFGTVLIPTSSGLDIAQRLANRYFDGKHRNDPEAILENMAPTREHGAVAPKNPWWLTTEIRTWDWPWSKVNNINKPVDTYMNLVEKALQIQF